MVRRRVCEAKNEGPQMDLRRLRDWRVVFVRRLSVMGWVRMTPVIECAEEDWMWVARAVRNERNVSGLKAGVSRRVIVAEG